MAIHFAVYTDAKKIVFEPHNLDSICRAVKSLGDSNIALTLQTGIMWSHYWSWVDKDQNNTLIWPFFNANTPVILPGSSALTGNLIGRKGSGPGEFQYPLGLRSHGGALYIADAGNNRIQVLNSTLSHALSIQETPESGGFDRPNDVCIDRNGMIIIADTFKNALHWFSQEGIHQRTLTGLLNRPFSLCIASDNSVVVADTGNHRVRVISQISGQKNLVFGRYGKEEGDFDGPHSVAVDGHDNIYVADLYNQRLQVFDRQGGFLRVIGAGLNLQAPRSIAINKGKIYIVDWGYTYIQVDISIILEISNWPISSNQLLQVVNLKGAPLFQFGVYSQKGEQITPNSIAVDIASDSCHGNSDSCHGNSDRVFISDCNNHKVYHIKMDHHSKYNM